MAFITYSMSFLALVCIPISLFYAASPNVTFSALGLASLLLVVMSGHARNLLPPLRALGPFFLFVTWALVTCLWSPTPANSLANVGKMLFATLGAVSFYVYLNQPNARKLGHWFMAGYFLALGLLILDEIMKSSLLRLLHGPEARSSTYYHCIAILVLGLWPLLIFIRDQHPARKLLLVTVLAIGVFSLSDHGAALAFIISLVAFTVTYLSPQFFMRTAAVLSTLIILGFPFAVKDLEPTNFIQSCHSMMLKPSYYHRLFIMKRTATMALESPWIGHGLDVYRTTCDRSKTPDIETRKMVRNMKSPSSHCEELDHDAIGQALHPHNISLQIWYETGAIGAFLFALFILCSLWRLSNLKHKRFELAAFTGLYASIFTITHVSFGAWQTWWLLSVSIIIAMTLRQTIKNEDHTHKKDYS